MPGPLLTDRTAIVTGAARGLGEGIARAFAAHGCAVGLFSRDLASLESLAAEIRAEGGKALAVAVDVTDAAAVEAASARVAAELGAVDILVNNAAIAPSAPFLEMSDAMRDAVLDTNVRGPWHCTRAVLGGMVERGFGRVINISSVTGPLVSGKGMTAYGASKGALSGFTRSLALEVAEHGVTVNAILPGSFDTPMLRALAEPRGSTPDAYVRELGATIPVGRLGTIEEMGELAAFLASEHARYITGAEIVMDGGNVIQEHK
ncbi:MAG: SDR family oxidoreductase [Chromatiales bacterium]|nr:SDR family oxidoreductase [Chromatiales bacterium]